MKLNQSTLTILKNFSKLNNGIWITQGDVLRTISSPSKNTYAIATVEDSFPVDFGIYDLAKFLGVVSMHKETLPELEFDAKHVYIKGINGRSKISYRFTDKEMLTVPPSNKTITLPSTDLTVMLQQADYKWIIDTAALLESTHIAIRSDGKTNVSLVTFDPKNDSAHQESLEIAGASGCNGSAFDLWWQKSDFDKLIEGTYEITLSNRGISHFKSQEMKLEYFMSFDAKNNKKPE